MPKNRVPWLDDEIMSGLKTIEFINRMKIIALVVILCLGLFSFMGA